MTQAEVDEQTLGAIAANTGGAFFRATDTASLEAIYARIDQLEKTTREVSHDEHHDEQFAWLLLPGLALLAGELVLSTTLLRRLP
jgi:Ca-activated chloride channel family protein